LNFVTAKVVIILRMQFSYRVREMAELYLYTIAIYSMTGQDYIATA